MQVLFPDWLINATVDLDAIFAAVGTKLKLTILVRNPEFSTRSTSESTMGDGVGTGTTSVNHITSFVNLSDLLDHPAWQDVNNDWYEKQNWNDVAEQSVDVSMGDTPVPGDARSVNVVESSFLYWPQELSGGGKPTVATGFVLSIDNPALTTYHGRIVMIWRPEQPMYLTGESDVISSRIGAADFLFSYVERNITTLDPAEGWDITVGGLTVVVPTLDWETARCAHVWIDPQRINYVINPSFRIGPFGWRSTEAMAGASGGIKRDGESSCLRMTGTSPMVLESNYFPTNYDTETWCVSAQVSGAGNWRIGIVFFQPSMAESEAIYLHTDWYTIDYATGNGTSKESDFHRIFQSFPTPDSTLQGLVRIEFQSTASTQCWVDEVLAAPEDGPGTYFDASWPFSQPGDYSWYGSGTGSFTNQSYSLFYNNRANLKNLIFGYLEDDPFDMQPVRYNGEAQKWVPEGVNIVPHWDDVFSTRVHTWMDDVIVPPVDYTTAYKTVVTTLPVTPP